MAGTNLFGPDGMLYIGMGDGGSQGDPHGKRTESQTSCSASFFVSTWDRGESVRRSLGQSVRERRGAGERDLGDPGCAIRGDSRSTVAGGMLYIADVGQDKYEEINVVPMSAAGVNYGWSTMDGPSCFKIPLCVKVAGSSSRRTGIHMKAGACSIIGGFVYRGRRNFPRFRVSTFIPIIATAGCGATRTRRTARTGRGTNGSTAGSATIVSFGEDAEGELYICSSNGRVYKIVKSAGAAG